MQYLLYVTGSLGTWITVFGEGYVFFCGSNWNMFAKLFIKHSKQEVLLERVCTVYKVDGYPKMCINL